MSECIEWPASKFSNGYGRLGRSPSLLAHRFVYELLHGPIAEEMEVRHSCDNPPCVNPDHLRLGTHAENMAEIAERDRWRNQYRVPTKCRARGHDLTLHNAVRLTSNGSWKCRRCQAEGTKKRRDSEKARETLRNLLAENPALKEQLAEEIEALKS